MEKIMADYKTLYKQGLKREKTEFTKLILPSKDAYIQAFNKLFAQNKQYRQILLENYYAPNHAITAEEMAEKFGYKKFSGANSL